MSNITANEGLSKWRNDLAKGLNKLLTNLRLNWQDHQRINDRLEALEKALKDVGSGGGNDPVTLPDMFADPNEGYKFNDTSLYAKVMVGYLQSRYATIAEKYDDVTAKYNGATSPRNTIAISNLEGRFTRVADTPSSDDQTDNACGSMGTWMYMYHLTTENSTRRAVTNNATQKPKFQRGDWQNEFWKHTNPARQIAIRSGYVDGAESTVGWTSLAKTDVHDAIKASGIYMINTDSNYNNKSTVFVGGQELFGGDVSDAYATLYCPDGISVATQSSTGKILNVASSRKPMVGFIGKPGKYDTVLYLYEYESETAFKFVPKEQGEIIMTKHMYEQTSASTDNTNVYVAWPNRDINYYSR